MLIGEIKKYIRECNSVSKFEIALKFNYEDSQIEAALELLISKGFIIKEKPTPQFDKQSKCGGCPMGCKPKEQESCSPTPNFYIYRIKEN